MEPPLCLVNGELMLGEKSLGHRAIVARNIDHQEETSETTVGVVRPRETAPGIVITIGMMVHVVSKRIENETMTREGGIPFLARVVHVAGGRDHLVLIVEMTITRSVSVEEWRHDATFSCLSAPLVYIIAI